MVDNKIKTIFRLGILGASVVSLLLLYEIVSVYQQAKSLFLNDVQYIFKHAIDVESKDKASDDKLFMATLYNKADTSEYFILETEAGKSYIKKSDLMKSRTVSETNDCILQTYYNHFNPINTVVLDSIFNTFLSRNIHCSRTAVRYKDNKTGKVAYSTPDTTSLKSAYHVQEVMMGIENEISLQGYIFVSWWEVLGKSKGHVWGLIISWVLVLVVVFSSVSFLIYRKKKKSVPTIDLVPVCEPDSVPALTPIPFSPETRILILAEISPQEHTIVQLTSDLYWDIKSSKLTRNGQEEVHLTVQFAQLMTLFLSKTDYFVSRDELLEELGGKDSAGVKDRLDQAIRRFRKALESVPEIQIENDRGKGYMMTITSN